eukprot:scaffold107379_cov68-Phaeocystis_antarctica.AAC.1
MGRAPGDVRRRVAAPALCRFDGGQVGGQAGQGFTLYVSKRSVSVKLYQISQSGGLGQSARLFDFNVFMMDINQY